MALKKTNRTLIILFFAISLFLPNFGLASNNDSLEWQKINLEKTLSTKLERALNSYFREGRYFYSINIPLTETKPLESESGGGNSGNSFDLPKPRLSDSASGKAKEDFIVFSKLGMEAPYVDKYFELLEKTKMLGKKNDSSEIKLINSNNVFDFIEKVEIAVTLDQQISPEKRKEIEQSIKDINWGLRDLVPVINFNYKALSPKTGSSFMQDLALILEKSENLLGMILAAITLGIFGLLIFNKYRKMKEELESNEAAGNGVGNGAIEQETHKEDDEDSTQNENDVLLGALDSKMGIDRFAKFLKTNPSHAVILVKKWLMDSSEKLKAQALVAIVQFLETSELDTIFSGISSPERSKWKKIILEQGQLSNLAEIDFFISAEVINSILTPGIIEDSEVEEMLLKLNPKSAKEFLEVNKEFTGLFLNALSTTFVDQMLSNFSDDELPEILEKGYRFNLAQAENLSASLKTKLGEHTDEDTVTPFMSTVLELLPKAMPSKEGHLYKILIDDSSPDRAVEAGKKALPSFLVFKLSNESLKECLQGFGNKNVAKLLYTASEDDKKRSLGLIAPEATKARRMFEIEFENIDKSDSLKAEVLSKREQFLYEFTLFIRNSASTKKQLQKELNVIVEDHFLGGSQDSKPELKAVS